MDELDLMQLESMYLTIDQALYKIKRKPFSGDCKRVLYRIKCDLLEAGIILYNYDMKDGGILE